MLTTVQVQVEGFVQKVSDEESEQYFHGRARDIQIAPALGVQVLVLLFSTVLILILEEKKISLKYLTNFLIYCFRAL